MEQIKLIKLAYRSAIVHGNLRIMATDIILLAAEGLCLKSLSKARQYLVAIKKQKINAKEAITIAEKILSKDTNKSNLITRTRQEAAALLEISIDSIRNWEMNGLLEVPRADNRYRIYTNQEVDTLKIIRTLKSAGYSLAAIRRMLTNLNDKTNKELTNLIDTVDPEEDFFYVTDRLLSALEEAQQDAMEIIHFLEKAK